MKEEYTRLLWVFFLWQLGKHGYRCLLCFVECYRAAVVRQGGPPLRGWSIKSLPHISSLRTLHEETLSHRMVWRTSSRFLNYRHFIPFGVMEMVHNLNNLKVTVFFYRIQSSNQWLVYLKPPPLNLQNRSNLQKHCQIYTSTLRTWKHHLRQCCFHVACAY